MKGVKLTKEEINHRREVLSNNTIKSASKILGVTEKALNTFIRNYGANYIRRKSGRTVEDSDCDEKKSIGMIDFENRIQLERIRDFVKCAKSNLRLIFESYGYTISQIDDFIDKYLVPFEHAMNVVTEKYPTFAVCDLANDCEAFQSILKLGENISPSDLYNSLGIEANVYNYWSKKYGRKENKNSSE